MHAGPPLGKPAHPADLPSTCTTALSQTSLLASPQASQGTFSSFPHPWGRGAPMANGALTHHRPAQQNHANRLPGSVLFKLSNKHHALTGHTLPHWSFLGTTFLPKTYCLGLNFSLWFLLVSEPTGLCGSPPPTNCGQNTLSSAMTSRQNAQLPTSDRRGPITRAT